MKTQQIFVTVSIYLLYLCAKHSFIWFNFLKPHDNPMTKQRPREVKYFTQGIQLPGGTG